MRSRHHQAKERINQQWDSFGNVPTWYMVQMRGNKAMDIAKGTHKRV